MLSKETKNIQTLLADYCHLKEVGPIPGTIEKNLPQYRRLIYNIFDDALRGAYPITHSQLSNDQWDELIEDFVRNGNPSNPQLFKMPFDLIDFCIRNDYSEKFNLPFLIDLLKFEWIEIDVHTMKDVHLPKHSNNEVDILNDALLFTPYLRLVELSYPIHQIKNKEVSELLGQYYLLVYRMVNGVVKYLELNQFTAIIVNTLINDERNMQSILDEILVDQSTEASIKITEKAVDFVNTLIEKKIILGKRT